MAALVIRADCLGFDKGQETLRWNQMDKDMCDRLSVISTYSRFNEDFENLVNSKYSDRQFSLSFERLFYSDAKLYTYTTKLISGSLSSVKEPRDVHFAVLMSSFEQYARNYGLKGLMEKILDISLKK